jgi:transposase
MLGDITQARDIYIACGYTDMRKSIDGLAAIVQQQFQLDPFSSDYFTLTLHCMCQQLSERGKKQYFTFCL